MANLIRMTDLGLRFRVYKSKQFSLKEAVINKLARRRYDNAKEIWALKGVSLHLREGDRIGIVGLNGAGKTTLLKCIARIYPPTEGRIEVNGFAVPLLEIGLGFNHELSGLENVFLAGAILGFSRRQMEQKLDRIFEFSELSDFMDVPLKYYSAGMMTRLAFTVSTEVEPEILLLDEVFSAGDAGFVEKSAHRMEQLIDNSRIVCLVSHNPDLVTSLCNRAIMLHRGQIQKEGTPDEVVEYYREFSSKGELGSTIH